MALLDVRGTSYNSRAAARYRRARSKARRRRWQRKAKATRALITARRALTLAKRLRPPLQAVRLVCAPVDTPKTQIKDIGRATWQPVFSRMPDPAKDGRFREVIPYFDAVNPALEPYSVNHATWRADWAKDNNPNGTMWAAMFDAGSAVFNDVTTHQGANAPDNLKVTHDAKPVCAVSFPLNAIALDTSLFRETKRFTNEIYSKKLKFNYNIRIRDAHTDGLNRSIIDRSLQIVTVHMYLVQVPVNGDCVHEPFAAINRRYDVAYTNLFYRAIIENMFEKNPLLMDVRKQQDFINLKLRRGTKSKVHLNSEDNESLAAVWDYDSTHHTRYPPAYSATDSENTRSEYARAYPFKVLAHKTHRLGSHGVSDMIAHYEVDDSFTLNLGKERYTDADGTAAAETSHFPAGSLLTANRFDKYAYHVIMIHNGAMYSGVPTTAPTADSDTVWSTWSETPGTPPTNVHQNPYPEDHAARVWCKTEVEHVFTST